MRTAKVRQGVVKDKRGWCFEVFYDNRPYPNFISALYKTRIGATRKLKKYLKTGEFSLYGNAERR